MNFLKRIFDHEYKEMQRFSKIADEIEGLENSIFKLTDDQLKNKTTEFKKRLKNGELLDDLIVEAFAVVREAAYRVIGEKPFYVQLLGGLAIHYGNIAEMKTGEGKTLTSTMPAYLNALTGKGVHIITVNEYLATRDAEWMGNIYKFLGLTVGVNHRDLSPKEKQEAYNCDVLYSTNNEVGFDYLRDNMVIRKEDKVQRELNFVIIDEVDSVLIDEARTPLIISGGFLASANLYKQADRFVKTLKEDQGFIYDEKTKATALDETGVKLAEKAFNLQNLFDLNNTTIVHYINQALRANFSMKKDFDYVIQDGRIVIVDQFTGRLMHGRNYSDGLHQAIEAKENVEIGEETKTLATITFQNLFRMYKKISGMTGTAKTEEEEFREIYNMYVICIPTNKPIIREDLVDLMFGRQNEKYKAIIRSIKKVHKTGQPILVGTVAVETSELISSMLKREGVQHEVLNAKNHAREAEIIAKAGHKGSLTIATNMAGRGTDIKLTDETKALGGLCVIGTERHESRRIDNQLRGRSGRQGDPGISQFYVSFEDELMVRFGTERARDMLEKFGFNKDEPIRHSMFGKMVETAQRRVEGNNFDARKTLLQYDDVVNQQRVIIYEKRNEILLSDTIYEMILDNFINYAEDLVMSHLVYSDKLTELDLSEILEAVNTKLLRNSIDLAEVQNKNSEQLIDFLYEKISNEYESKVEKIPIEIRQEFEKAISLRVIDTYWMEHINTMEHLKEGIHLRGYGQEDPLRAYTKEGYEIFENLLRVIDREITIYLLNSEIRQNIESKKVVENEIVNESDDSIKRTPKKVKKIGRNEPCPCGSGKKYKNCCGR